MKTVMFAVSIICSLVFASAGADGGHHGRYYDDDRISYSLGLNFGYPYAYGPHYRSYHGHYRYQPRYGYYPRYGPYRRPYAGSIGLGYHSGYHDSLGLFFSLPLYFGPRYEPAPPPMVLVPSVARATRSVPADCLQQREYQTEILIDGKAVPAYGTACLQADGSWRIVDGPFTSD